MHPVTSPTELYLPSLIEGDTDATLALFGGAGDVADVLSGGVGGVMFPYWAAARHMYLSDRKARLEPVRTTRRGSRAVVEVVLHLTIDGRAVPLPVAIVGEEAGDKLVRVRSYHSTFPLWGRHAPRDPLLPPDEELRPADVVGRYMTALRAGDVDAILACLEPDAVVREPAGGEFVYSDTEGHRRFYAGILSRGGVVLDHCTMTDEGAACAIEYNVVRWGDVALPMPNPGIAVYERSAGGKLKAVRIYDDVEPPPASRTE
jgi:hypothetical protein